MARNLFTLEILNKYSWTGKTKTDESKKKFIEYKQIHQLFFDVIYLACNKYSHAQNEAFFKNNLLKHARLRIERAKNR